MCATCGVALFALMAGAPAPISTRGNMARADRWRCTSCGGVGEIPWWAK